MILVTGATGHIGNVLVRELIKKGYGGIRVLVPQNEDTRSISGLDVEILRGDIRDYETVDLAVKGVKHVFHLAGVISIMPGYDRDVHDINVKGTENVVRACMKYGVKRLLYTSSVHALREPENGIPIDENQPFDPENVAGFYAKTKAEATLKVLEGVEEGLDAVVVVPAGVIGPYDYRVSEMGYIIKARSEGRLKFYIDGAYDFVDVRDVVKGILLAFEKGKRGEVYILSGKRISIKNLLRMVDRLSGVKAPLFRIPGWLAHLISIFTPFYYRLTKKKPLLTPYAVTVLRSNSNITSRKAERELGYRKTDVEKTVRDTVVWFRRNRV